MAFIGIDLGGTKVAAAVIGYEGEVVAREVVPLAGRSGEAAGALVVRQAQALQAAAAAQGLGVEAVGICVPGIAYAETGRVWAPNIAGWDDYPLRDELQRAVGEGTGVYVDSDRACCILAETWRGAAQGCRDAIFLAVGTGIGAGILCGGRIVRGAHDIAGAIGWLALDRPFRAGYGPVGCFEYHASGPGLARVARDRMATDPAYAGRLRDDPDALTGAGVFEAFEAGDPLAAAVLDEAVVYWGMATANLVSLFNPEKIVFGGGVFGPAVRFLERIGQEAQRWAQPVAMRRVTLEASALGGDAGLYGAARLALLAHAEPRTIHDA